MNNEDALQKQIEFYLERIEKLKDYLRLIIKRESRFAIKTEASSIAQTALEADDLFLPLQFKVECISEVKKQLDGNYIECKKCKIRINGITPPLSGHYEMKCYICGTICILDFPK